MKICLNCKSPNSKYKKYCIFCKNLIIQKNGFDIYASELLDSSKGFSKNHFSFLYKLEKKNFWFLARNKVIIFLIKKYKSKFKNYLEIGCGTGFVLNEVSKQFSNSKITGSEIFLEGLNHARKRIPHVNLIQMDARNIPFKNEYDLIGLFDVIEHVDNDNKVMKEAFDALKLGGILIISVPQHKWLWSTADEFAGHYRRYSKADIEYLIKKTNFHILRSSSFMFFLLPVMFLSRFFQKYKKNADPYKEFKLPFLINKLFKWVLFLEYILMTIGINLPIGGSRFIVAKKK
jgi:SAM-dependent methyltransferase